MADHDPDHELVLLDVSERIATVTLNRPEARNALSSALLARLRFVMAEADADDAVDVIILTGTDPAFSAGLDLKEIGSASSRIGVRADNGGSTPGLPWERTAKPLIGAVNGVCVTGGFELALQCDFLVASERARFADTHTRVGILPGWGLSALLPQAIGIRRAVEMSLTGNYLGAEEAAELGLVNHVVAHADLLPIARKLASDIAGNNAAAVRELLASYRALHRMNVADAERHELAVSRDWLSRTYTPEAVEARRIAIMERGRGQQHDSI